MMFVTLHSYFKENQDETIEAVHVIITPGFIRLFLEKGEEITLYFCGTNSSFWRENGWRNLDTGEQWKEVSICPK